MIVCNNEQNLKTAHTAFEGGNFKFDFYRDLKTFKFFTKQSLDDAIFLLETLCLTHTTDFKVVPNFDY